MGVTVVTRLRARAKADPQELERAALAALYAYFHPVRGGPDGTGWPFGRSVVVGEVYAVLQRLAGVELVEEARLFPADPVERSQRGPGRPPGPGAARPRLLVRPPRDGADVVRGTVDDLATPHPLGHLLPALYHDNDIAQRFTGALDVVLAPVLATLDSSHAYVDPLLAPLDFVDWLAEWVGVELGASWPEDRQRALVARAADLFAWRGTVRGVSEAVAIYTGVVPEVLESGATAWTGTPRRRALPGGTGRRAGGAGDGATRRGRRDRPGPARPPGGGGQARASPTGWRSTRRRPRRPGAGRRGGRRPQPTRTRRPRGRPPTWTATGPPRAGG